MVVVGVMHTYAYSRGSALKNNFRKVCKENPCNSVMRALGILVVPQMATGQDW